MTVCGLSRLMFYEPRFARAWEHAYPANADPGYLVVVSVIGNTVGKNTVSLRQMRGAIQFGFRDSKT
jgi:hypothetical protein